MINLTYNLNEIHNEIELETLSYYIKNDIYPKEINQSGIIYSKLSQITNKKSLPSFTINNFKGVRSIENLNYYTNYFGFDLDIDKKEVDKTKKLDTQTIKKIDSDLDILSYPFNDVSIFYKKSFSKTGLHIIIGFDFDLELNEVKYKETYNILKSYIEYIVSKIKTNYNYVLDNVNDISRMFFISYDKDCFYEKLNLLDNVSYTELVNNFSKSKKPFFELSKSIDFDINKTNSKYIKRLREIETNKGLEYTKLKDFLRNKTYNYGNGELIFLTKNQSLEGRKMLFNIYRIYYPNSDTFKPYYNNFQRFNSFIDKTKLSGKNQITLKWFFKGCNINGLDENYIETETDFLGTKYDFTFKIDRYISEKNNSVKDSLRDLINEKDILIKSKPNTGKTTFLINEIIKNNPSKTFLFLSNKNSLNDKLYNDVIKIITPKKVVKLYGGNKVDCVGSVYLSSIPGLFKFNNNLLKDIKIDYLIIDETHLIVDFIDINKNGYSYDDFKMLYRFINDTDIRKIYISGTPEYFSLLKGIYNFNYINIICENIPKKTIYLTINKNPKNRLLEYYKYFHKKGNIVDIYYNDKNKLESLKGETNGLLFTSDDKKNTEIINIIDTELLPIDKTMLFTSYGQEGLNFNNTEKRIVLIVGNDNTDFKDIYQFINRYRKGNIDIYMFMTSLNSYKKVFNENKEIIYVGNDTITKPFFEKDRISNEFREMKDYLLKNPNSKIFGNNLTSEGFENWFLEVKNYKKDFITFINTTIDVSEKRFYIDNFFNLVRNNVKIENEKGENRFTNYKDLNTKHLQNLFKNYSVLWEYLLTTNINTIDPNTLETLNYKVKDLEMLNENFKVYKKELKYINTNVKKIESLKGNYDLDRYIFKVPQIFNDVYYSLKVGETIETIDNKLPNELIELMKTHNIKDIDNLNLFSYEFKDIKEKIERNKYEFKKGGCYIEMDFIREIINSKKYLNPEKNSRFIVNIIKNMFEGKISNKKLEGKVKRCLFFI